MASTRFRLLRRGCRDTPRNRSQKERLPEVAGRPAALLIRIGTSKTMCFRSRWTVDRVHVDPVLERGPSNGAAVAAVVLVVIVMMR